MMTTAEVEKKPEKPSPLPVKISDVVRVWEAGPAPKMVELFAKNRKATGEDWSPKAVKASLESIMSHEIPVYLAAWVQGDILEGPQGILTGHRLTSKDSERMFDREHIVPKSLRSLFRLPLPGTDDNALGYVHDLLVEPDCQNRGIAKALLREAGLRFRQHGARALLMRVRASPSDAFHKACLSREWVAIDTFPDTKHLLIGKAL